MLTTATAAPPLGWIYRPREHRSIEIVGTTLGSRACEWMIDTAGIGPEAVAV
jgi:hypothetical protein